MRFSVYIINSNTDVMIKLDWIRGASSLTDACRHLGKVDEKASQLHTIASLGVLLDATGPGSSGSPTPTPLNGSAGGAGSGAGTRLGSSAYKDSTRRTTLDNNIDFQVSARTLISKAYICEKNSIQM